MLKVLSNTLVALLITINSFGTANSVYHEFTMNNVGGTCGTYVSTTSPTNTVALTVQFAIDYQTFTNQARIYYTTDGSTPSGSYGVPSGTTQVITASYACSYFNGTATVDIAQGTIPPLPTGTVVRYIVSAWHSLGGLEIFATGGTNTSSATATVFTYTVASVLPINMLSFSGKKENTGVKLTWVVSQEINVDRYEIYSSGNAVDFKLIGTKKAAGNTNLTTEYTFIDVTPSKGNNFYKIKSIDKDGKFTHSKIININFDNNRKPLVSTSGKELRINFNDSEKQNYTIVLVNNIGQKITTWTVADNGNNADYILQIPLAVKESIYHVGIKGSGKQFSQSVFIQ